VVLRLEAQAPPPAAPEAGGGTAPVGERQHSGTRRGVGQRRNVRGDRRELAEFRRIEKHR
jgi:hypothetical protein